MRDFRCPLRVRFGDRVRLEWLQINRSVDPGGPAEYEIPRLCVEALGIDCSGVGRTGADGHTVAAVWFTREQSDRMRRHRHARIVETAS